MKLLVPPRISDLDQCPYIEDMLEQHEFFFVHELSLEEMDYLLEKGWRKFGQFMFKPLCPSCSKCIPLRVDLKKFKESKNQRKFLKRNRAIVSKFCSLIYRPEHFEIYTLHGRYRFRNSLDSTLIEREQLFKDTFYKYTGTQILSEFYLEDKLIAFGILEESTNGLSSVYFSYHPEYEDLGLGHYGALSEILYAKQRGLSYYYLGYWVQENSFMNYKSRYQPHQLFDWETSTWSKNSSKS